MSVSQYINTDNPPSLSEIPQSAVEEIKTWRNGKMNNGEKDVMSVLVSPQKKTGEGIMSRLSETEEITPKKCSTKSTAGTHPWMYKTYFVRLAEESPKRNCDEQSESDSSTYDSFNFMETDVCRDSSDTDSNTSYSSANIEATIKVVEYEVASASNTDNLFTNDSSSGTDDFILAAVARAICHTSKCPSNFADTEENSSDSDSHDSELSAADYWVCVKCKNKQNNPMFRYCEKCYQIRKTHFPPRPRRRKSRLSCKRQTSLDFPSLQRSGATSEVGETLKRKRKRKTRKDRNPVYSITPTSSQNSMQSVSRSTPGRLAVGISQNEINSTDASSTDDDNTASQFYKVLNSTSAKEMPNNAHLSCSDVFNKVGEQITVQNTQFISKAQSKYKTSAKRKCYEQSKTASDTENETDFVLSQSISGGSQSTQKDSGFSSAPSSQEKSSSEQQIGEEEVDCISDAGNGGDSSDTVCDELTESELFELSQEKNNIHNTSEFDLQARSLVRHVSDIQSQSSTKQHVISPLVQSMSECSDAYTNMQPSSSNPELLNSAAIKENKIRSLQPVMLPIVGPVGPYGDFHSYGLCMTCLTAPKNGVFVHSRFLHLCCCYRCAVKIWNKNKKCPICNCAVKNVMKLFVH